LKEQIRQRLLALGHEVVDHGTSSSESTDYPDYAVAVSEAVSSGRAERGILVCSSGIGMSITANKVPGIRAALASQPEEVRVTREHNDANILALGANFIDPSQVDQMIDLFLHTEFQGGRHARRLDKIAAVEQRFLPAGGKQS
jgi:ribose 5-phosphate isomerase B